MMRVWYYVLAACAFSTSAVAQTSPQQYPNQLVHIVVPSSAGGVSDALARTIADKVGANWKQAVIVENRPGLAGTESVARSSADGYTLLVTSNGHTVINRINKNLPFDAVNDFTGVAQLASVPFVLVATRSLPVSDLSGLRALARTTRPSLTIAIPGIGSSASILSELFKATAGIDLLDIPFRGAGESEMAVQRGDVQLLFMAANIAVSMIQAGAVKPIAVVSEKRIPRLPNVPTMAEAGLSQMTYDAWFGVLAPAGTPKPIVEKIGADIKQVLTMPVVRSALEQQGFEVRFSGPADFNATIRRDAARYAQVFKAIQAPGK
ncbi:tripartite tricarboxylate transporter substrate-binding protein [Paraburkholderia nemoris]|uniref:tripartite tricarboxylate transporter substrate-binding protein n=1 Tax=Paraburkholderia nemoris TaxID=2793076 RepID=UPI0038B6F861